MGLTPHALCFHPLSRAEETPASQPTIVRNIIKINYETRLDDLPSGTNSTFRGRRFCLLALGTPSRGKERERYAFLAREWYAHQREDLDLEFMQSIDDALSQIVANPDQYPNVYRSLRRCVVRRFPFAIFMMLRSSRSSTRVETRKDGSLEGKRRLLNSSPAGTTCKRISTEVVLESRMESIYVAKYHYDWSICLSRIVA